MPTSTNNPGRYARPTPKTPTPCPPPEVTQRPAHDTEIPASAKRLAALAQQHGWTVWTTYSRGTRLTGPVVDQITVRMHNATQQAAATWIDGQFGNAVTRSPFRLLNSPQLRALIKGETA